MALFPKLSIDDFRRHIVYGFSSYEMVYAGPILDRKYNFITCHSRTFNLFAILTILFRKPFDCILLFFSFLLSLIPPSSQRFLALSCYLFLIISLSHTLFHTHSLLCYFSLSSTLSFIRSFSLSLFFSPLYFLTLYCLLLLFLKPSSIRFYLETFIDCLSILLSFLYIFHI